jgi:hypothetical protein
MAKTIVISVGYEHNRSLPLGREFVAEHGLQVGEDYALKVAQAPQLEVTGTLYSNGVLGGLTALYQGTSLKEGDKVEISFADGWIVLSKPDITGAKLQQATPQSEGVFDRQKLKHLHCDLYRPESFQDWQPRAEPDVYLVFGHIQRFTDYRYCCGASAEFLKQLGYTPQKDKPDAVLVDARSGAYVLAEFKMWSSDFRTNHDKEDIDVLICWEDDEQDRTVLPGDVLALKPRLAALVAAGAFSSDKR